MIFITKEKHNGKRSTKRQQLYLVENLKNIIFYLLINKQISILIVMLSCVDIEIAGSKNYENITSMLFTFQEFFWRC